MLWYNRNGEHCQELTPFELKSFFKARASLGKLVIESAGHLISKEELNKFHEEFSRFRNMKYISNPDLIELFYLDVEFHRLLDECIPGIIHDQVKVIADLTMNSRYIAYRNRFGGLTDQQIKVLCCDNHVAIIDALLKSDVSKGADAFVKDVCSGWESINYNYMHSQADLFTVQKSIHEALFPPLHGCLYLILKLETIYTLSVTLKMITIILVHSTPFPNPILKNTACTAAK